MRCGSAKPRCFGKIYRKRCFISNRHFQATSKDVLGYCNQSVYNIQRIKHHLYVYMPWRGKHLRSVGMHNLTSLYWYDSLKTLEDVLQDENRNIPEPSRYYSLFEWNEV